MSIDTNRAAKFVTKLLQLTTEKKIQWAVSDSPRKDGRAAFVTELEGKRLRLYRYHDEISMHPWAAPTARDGTCLEVLDVDRVTYTFESVSGLRNLYDLVSYSTSRVDELVDAVLEKS